MNFYIICFLLSFSSIFIFQEAYSYIDPGTGSYLIQLLIASFAAALYFIKVFWIQIKIFFVYVFAKIKKIFG